MKYLPRFLNFCRFEILTLVPFPPLQAFRFFFLSLFVSFFITDRLPDPQFVKRGQNKMARSHFFLFMTPVCVLFTEMMKSKSLFLALSPVVDFSAPPQQEKRFDKLICAPITGRATTKPTIVRAKT